MSDSIPMVITCCLRQGCNKYPLDVVDAQEAAEWEARMARSLEAALQVTPPRSTLATWALNLPVVVVRENLAEPTREGC